MVLNSAGAVSAGVAFYSSALHHDGSALRHGVVGSKNIKPSALIAFVRADLGSILNFKLGAGANAHAAAGGSRRVSNNFGAARQDKTRPACGNVHARAAGAAAACNA